MEESQKKSAYIKGKRKGKECAHWLGLAGFGCRTSQDQGTGNMKGSFLGQIQWRTDVRKSAPTI